MSKEVEEWTEKLRKSYVSVEQDELERVQPATHVEVVSVRERRALRVLNEPSQLYWDFDGVEV